MSSKVTANDPLRAGGTFDDQDMEDLTSHLANLPLGRGSHDGLDLGDNTEMLQGNLDRFRALAGDDSNDELFTSYGGLGLGLGVSDSTIITTTNYPTYGELAAKPPSYEDSIMYEQAPLAMHAIGLGGDGNGASGHPLLAGPGSTTESPSIGLSVGLLSEPQPLLSAAASVVTPGSAVTRETGSGPLGPLGGAAAEPPAGDNAGDPGSSLPAPGRGPDLQHQSSLARDAAASVAGGASSASPTLDPRALPGSAQESRDPQAPPPHGLAPFPLGITTIAGAAGGREGGGLHQQLHITVSDPIKREQGGLFGIKGGYVTYLVRAKGRPGNSRPETTVRRRFREFVALAELLKEKYRGYFVPPRPEKNAMEGQRMADGFVEERRLALERYLNKLARHPVIGASDELRLFLEVDGELADSGQWLALRPPHLGGSVLEGTAKFSKQILGLDRAVTDPVQAAQPTKKATDFMRAIKETARSMQSAPSASALPADEAALLRAREDVELLQGALTAASRAAEKLVSRLDRWSVAHGELGLAVIQMRNAEKAEGVALANHTGTLKQSGSLMHDTERLGTALVRSSRIGRKVTGRCAIELGCLHEYLGLMPAALKGLRARDKALLTADTLQSDLEGRRKAINELEAAGAKVLGGDAAKTKKVAELSGDVAVLEQSVSAARARYERIKEINHQEMSRLQAEMRTDMLSMLHHYAAIMSACSQRNLEIWLQAAAELQATPEQLQAAKACLVGSAAHQQQQQQPAYLPSPTLPAAPLSSPSQLAAASSAGPSYEPGTGMGPGPGWAAGAGAGGGVSGGGVGGWALGEVDLSGDHRRSSASAPAADYSRPVQTGYPL